MPDAIRCGERLEVIAVPGIPIVKQGDNLAALLATALEAAAITLADGDVLVVTSKVVSRAEGRFFDLAEVNVSPRALELAREVEKDPRLVELILRESHPERPVSRKARGVLVVRHRLGFIAAHAGIDASNAQPPDARAGSGPWALLLPVAPDESAAAIRSALEKKSGARIGVVISDSFGRPFRLGTVGAAIGISGLPPLWDRRGEVDLFGRTLTETITALGDQVAAAADLVAGQAGEGRALVLVRGLAFANSELTARALCRDPDADLYA